MGGGGYSASDCLTGTLEFKGCGGYCASDCLTGTLEFKGGGGYCASDCLTGTLEFKGGGGGGVFCIGLSDRDFRAVSAVRGHTGGAGFRL